jgi:putative copper export protein
MPYLVLVWLHVVAATAWIGGMVFVGAILVPLARPLPPRDRAALLERVGVRFSLVAWVCIGLLLVSGPWLLLLRGRLELLIRPSALIGVAVGQVLLAKLGLIFCMVLLSLIHDSGWGPSW